jgi:membrane glycosyltransferase
MLLHCAHIWQIFRGKDSGWSTQQRQNQSTPWTTLLRFHWLHTLAGCALFALLYWQQSILLYWLMPVYLGLMISLPLSKFLSSSWASTLFSRMGVLRTREEACHIEEIATRDRAETEIRLSVNKLALDQLLAAPERLLAHQRMTVIKPILRRGYPDMTLAAATMKIEQANTLEEACTWMNNKERLAALSDNALLSQLSNLYHRGARRTPVVRLGTCELVD